MDEAVIYSLFLMYFSKGMGLEFGPTGIPVSVWRVMWWWWWWKWRWWRQWNQTVQQSLVCSCNQRKWEPKQYPSVFLQTNASESRCC